MDITTTPSWHALLDAAEQQPLLHLRQLFAADPGRAPRFSVDAVDLRADYSKQRIDTATMARLIAVAKAADVEARREAMFTGEAINSTEGRAVLHTALRARRDAVINVADADGSMTNVVPEVHQTLDRMADFANDVRSGRWLGHSGQQITTIVNIGIGGSDLGPAMAYQALLAYKAAHIDCHFVSNVDGADIHQTLERIDPATTLFIVASKTFTTIETLTNAITARGLAARRLRRRWCCRWATFRRPVDQHGQGQRVRHRSGQHVRFLGLGRRSIFGRLGDRAVFDGGHRPRRVRSIPRRVPGDG